ncbi:hypothetical protein SAMN05444487_102188 [Marininema mesophilum]|uniref:Uncharacterized protein n=1 Tax=Marininema mesophilum TaxID=1048340 RepID=A0A1H2SE34_9BACL|nr:hypothetical protein [Marininema mesophilum]SDW29906.1 hypothetical protein SAMN05444487_102188 [Marininema mesophilum]
MISVLFRKWMVVGLLFMIVLGGILPKAAEAEKNPQWFLFGTMRYLNLEGGCWIVEGDNGERFQLIGDPAILKGLQIEGLRVTLLVESASNRYGKCMVGRYVRLIRLIHYDGGESPERSSFPNRKG